MRNDNSSVFALWVEIPSGHPFDFDKLKCHWLHFSRCNHLAALIKISGIIPIVESFIGNNVLFLVLLTNTQSNLFRYSCHSGVCDDLNTKITYSFVFHSALCVNPKSEKLKKFYRTRFHDFMPSNCGHTLNMIHR